MSTPRLSGPSEILGHFGHFFRQLLEAFLSPCDGRCSCSECQQYYTKVVETSDLTSAALVECKAVCCIDVIQSYEYYEHRCQLTTRSPC
ncbi:hypothetical protein E2C01_048403 [Portunus trituberculatus]|uniref:Uncharacterized protein n=1 Tax=Portunus trituberculatus TaxID=210409 RepID=A0A5B7GAX2_PORTR|nr:hypothetical protein [Portunus trituberculatus]